jgi:hypothetical protein
MAMKLSETVPWSDEDWGGFAISVVIAPILFALLVSCADGLLMRPIHMGLIMFAGLVLMNSNPMRRMGGAVQYLACAVGAGTIRAGSDPRTTVFEFFIYGIIFGFFAFCLIRANWWFYWNNASRRTTLEKVLGSIFYTVLFPLGAVMGFCRLIGIGVEEPTTAFQPQPAPPTSTTTSAPAANVLETILEDPALTEHARRIEMIRAAQAGRGAARQPSGDKEAASESI